MKKAHRKARGTVDSEEIAMIEKYLEQAVNVGASDIFLIPGIPISMKVQGNIEPMGKERVFPREMDKLIAEIYEISDHRTMDYLNDGDDDFSFAIANLSRFRASIMRQRGSLGGVIRVVKFELPSAEDYHIPPEVLSAATIKKGLVLVTGPAGSGKSTTLACMIDKINHERNAHIITLEDPIEFLYRHDKAVVTQREIGLDTENYLTGLRAALRQAPDVILVGEMRDYETISAAVTAAETGHLVFSTLHTLGAANTINRIIGVFPEEGQDQIRTQLSLTLQKVISQQLVPSTDGKLIPAFEIMNLNKAIRNKIRDREGKIHQIDSDISQGAAEGMITMGKYLENLLKAGMITEETYKSHTPAPDEPAKARRSAFV